MWWERAWFIAKVEANNVNFCGKVEKVLNCWSKCCNQNLGLVTNGLGKQGNQNKSNFMTWYEVRGWKQNSCMLKSCVYQLCHYRVMDVPKMLSYFFLGALAYVIYLNSWLSLNYPYRTMDVFKLLNYFLFGLVQHYFVKC
jgi:hypothetical protein